jgi:hypothetical protein
MTTAPLDSLDARIRRAIAEKRLLEIRYKRAVRLVEPHDYGLIDGTKRLLIFQDQTFAGSRGQLHRQHYQWETLYARVT